MFVSEVREDVKPFLIDPTVTHYATVLVDLKHQDVLETTGGPTHQRNLETIQKFAAMTGNPIKLWHSKARAEVANHKVHHWAHPVGANWMYTMLIVGFRM